MPFFQKKAAGKSVLSAMQFALFLCFFEETQTHDHMVFRLSAKRRRNVLDLYFKVFRRGCGIFLVIFCKNNITGIYMFQKLGILFYQKAQTGSGKITQSELVFQCSP